MLIQLTPEQVSTHWDDISVAIAISLPPTIGDNASVMGDILASILKGKMHCWVALDNHVIVGVVTTRFMFDDIVGAKNLLIYTIYSPPDSMLKEITWHESIDILKKFGKENGCFQIIAYSNVQYVIKMATNGLKGKAEYTVLTWEI